MKFTLINQDNKLFLFSSKIINECDIDELNQLKQKKGTNQKNEHTLNLSHHNRHDCTFQHGEILPFDPNTKTRTIRISYRCSN